MKKKKHIGSSFESFLEEEGILEEIHIAAVKAVIAKILLRILKNPRFFKPGMNEFRCWVPAF